MVKGWQVVYRGERLKADLIAAVLEANGIRVEVFGDHAYSAAVNFTDARVMVPQEEAPAADEVISPGERRPPRLIPTLGPRLADGPKWVVVLALVPSEC